MMRTLTLAAALLVGLDTYDPLRLAADRADFRDFTIRDSSRKRDLPIRVYLPRQQAAAPVVLFSHGLGGNREGSAYLGHHWAGRGYVVVFLQHPGSDDSVWKDTSPGRRMAAMQKAASAENFQLRVKDVPAALDQLEKWNRGEGHPLRGRMDLKRVGMSGHSFGAVTTQAVSGQWFPLGRSFTDPRIQAAVAMSPSSPRRGEAKQTFQTVKIPWLLLTGTKDTAMIGNATVESRLAVFPSLPPGSKYELVLDRAEHSAFTDRPLPGDTEKRNPNHHKVILALTTAFWDAYLKNDPQARQWLDGEGPRKLMEKADRWQKK